MPSLHLLALPLFLFFRISSTYIVTTSFVPDEYWQSLEVAHRLVFGYGYLTWEWRENIRSYCYPVIIASVYKVLMLLNLDYPNMLTLAPRLLQATACGIGDYLVYRLSRRVHGPTAATWTAFCILTSWFLFYTSTRTITNTAEMAVSAVALYKYPWAELKHSHAFNYLWFAAVSFMFRPTAAVLWVHLYACHFLKTPFKRSLLKKTCKVGIVALALMVTCDSWFSGHLVLTSYNFLYFNWIHDIGSFYGSHPWHWYISQGIPATLSTHTLPFLFGVSFISGLRHRNMYPLYGVVVTFVFVLSFLSHKEFRFLLPIFHLIMCICGATLASFAKTPKRIFFTAALLILGNAPLAFYFGTVHQQGTLKTMQYLSEQVTNDAQILFLMPCHSTPFYSHIHRNVSMRFLTCEPNFDARKTYVDEADKFYRVPSKWLTENIGKTLPTHVVLFDILVSQVSEFLSQYRICKSIFHTHFPQDRIGKFILVYCR